MATILQRPIFTLFILCFILSLGLSILGYLNPLHSPMGHDYLPNAISFFVVGLGIASYFFGANQRLDQPLSLKFGMSTMTWQMLAIVLLIQPMLHYIRYPDALVFPVLCLVWVIGASIITSNITSEPEQKRQFLAILAPFVYVMAGTTFIIQLMQVLGYQITWHGWPVTRNNALPDRMDGNFGQANHTSYALLLGMLFAIYQLHTTREKIHQVGLLILLMALSIGIALTKSRAVLIMLVAGNLVYFFGQQLPLPQKVRNSLGIIGFFAFSYWLGGAMLSLVSPEKVSVAGAVARIGSDSQRASLLHRGWLIFQESPIVGVGWNNFAFNGLKYVDTLDSFTFSDNAHMFAVQLGSELGILGLLCLLPVAWVLIKSIHFHHSRESALALAFVVASVIYACFEYPLWYFRYLLLFGVFLALIDQKNYQFPAIPRYVCQLIATFFVSLALISVYYSYTYLDKGYLTYNLGTSVSGGANTSVKVATDKPLFGFKNYAERERAVATNADLYNLNYKLGLFDRVLIAESSPYNLFSYATLLSYAGKTDQALIMYKSACRIQESHDNCEEVAGTLEDMARIDKKTFENAYESYMNWFKARKVYKDQ